MSTKKSSKKHDDGWDEYETYRQDKVDNAIFDMVKDITPIGYLQWDMELIGEIRDVILEYVVNQKKWMTEQQFYPYRELTPEPDGNITLQPFKGLIVTDEQLVTAMRKEVEDIDAEQLAEWAGHCLGGKCWYLEDNTYSFEPDENYYGAFNFIKDKANG
jgi:hypothetical protein